MHTPRELETVLKILNVLADIQKWELANIGFIGTITGRQLYYGLVRSSSVDHGNLNVGLMKNIYHSEHIGVTERGVRLAVRALESEGGGQSRTTRRRQTRQKNCADRETSATDGGPCPSGQAGV